MSHELKLERIYDAPPDVVFDTFVAPETQAALHGEGNPGWIIHRAETDIRVGGTSTYSMGAEGEEPDVETRVCLEVDRPRRLVFRHSMQIAEWGRSIETEMTITFEEQDGKTLVRVIQTGFESAELRDGFMEGWSTYFDTLRRVIGERQSDSLKARHDSDG